MSSGLVLSALREHQAVQYLKPVQTGYPEDSDARLVSRVVDAWRLGDSFVSKTLFAWKDAVSPHLAAGTSPPDDASVVSAIRQSVAEENSAADVVVLETAGGPGSPGPSGRLQCDLLRPLRYPALLVGDGQLGGISTTLSSYEMLKLRGYSIPVIAVVENSGLENYKSIEKHVDAAVFPLSPCLPPPDQNNYNDDGIIDRHLKQWLVDTMDTFRDMESYLRLCAKQDREWLEHAGERALHSIWWPFTQHQEISSGANVTVIDSRDGEDMVIMNSNNNNHTLRSVYDGCASWWTQGMDAEHMPGMALEVAGAIGRYGHVIFPRNIHKPALDVAQQLIREVGKGWASRAFFSDNGSTAVEVALKMAFRKYMVDHNILHDDEVKLHVLGVQGAYHGDTLGTMDAVPPSVFNGRLQTPWFEGRGLFLDPPTVAMKNGAWVVQTDIKDYDVYIRESLDAHAKAHPDHCVGACIIEPVVQGAGGMRMIDPEFHRAMARVCRERNIPLIVDEVFTGIWRLGAPSAATSLLGITPDIGCYAKLLTGGVVPMSITLSSEDVFNAFQGDTKALALLHGHSYTAHPVGCAAGRFSLQAMGNPLSNANVCSPVNGTCTKQCETSCNRLIELWDQDRVEKISHLSRVKGIFSLGTVVSVQLESDDSGYQSGAAAALAQKLLERNIYARPLGDVIYIMVTPFTTKDTCHYLLQQLESVLLLQEG